MKKLFFILVLIFLSVQALAIETVVDMELLETTSTRPTITLEYKENVTIADYSLTKGSENYNLTFTTDDNQKFEFIPDGRLDNGLYMLTVVAEDRVKNALQINQPIEVKRESMDIWVINPAFGVSNTSIFNATLQTEFSSECKASLNTEAPVDFATGYPLIDSEDGITHIIVDFGTSPFTFSALSEDSGGMERTIRAVCKDEYGLLHNQNLYLAYDNTPPTIGARFDPARIIDVSEPFAELKVNVDDRSICSYTENGVKRNFYGYDPDNVSAYKKTHNATIDFSYLKNRPLPELFEEVTVDFQVECKNLAGFSESKNLTIKISFEQSFSIEMVEPGPSTNKESVDFIIKTSINANCKYGKGDKIINWTNPFDPVPGNKIFSVNLGKLSEGSYTYGVVCNSDYTTKNKAFTFKVDRIKPKNVTVTMTDPTCTLESIEGEIKADDNDEIAFYNYSIEGVVSGITTSGKINKRVTLESGKKYVINVKAYDTAGNAADGSDTFTASNKSAVKCDKKDPYSQLKINRTEGRALAKVMCFDSDSGCKDRFNYGTASYQGNCTAETGRDVGKEISITSDIYLCWTVFDLNNNEDSDYSFIKVEEGPDHCTNSIKDGTETDIDCGGECTKCDLNKTCENDYDCLTGNCVDGKCEPADHCTNGKKDGTETDIDCGGPCKDCSIGKDCESDDDCKSDNCSDGLCESSEEDDDDSDDDGMPDGWEERYGLDPDDPTDADKDADGDGYSNLEEYKKGTDPTDSTDKPSSGDPGPEKYISLEEEGKGFFGWAFIITGILFIIAGLVLLFLENKKKEKEPSRFKDPRLIDDKTKLPEKEEEIESDEEKKEKEIRTREKYGAMFKKRAKKRKQERKELLKEFDSPDKKETVVTPLKITDDSEKKDKAEKEIKKLSEGEEGADKKEEKAEKEIEDEEEFKEENIGKDVFQELEDIKKETSTEEETEESKLEVVSIEEKEKKEKEDLKKLEKKVEEIKKKEEVEETNDEKELDTDDVFKKLSELAGESHKFVKEAVSKAKYSNEDFLKVFANVTSKKQIDTNVFKAILSQLLDKGHISKHVVAEMLFEFLDQELLTHKEVSGLIRNLKLTAK